MAFFMSNATAVVRDGTPTTERAWVDSVPLTLPVSIARHWRPPFPTMTGRPLVTQGLPLAVTLFTLLGASLSTAAQPSTACGAPTRVGRCFDGEPFLRLANVAGPEQCCQACLAHRPGCAFWEVRHERSWSSSMCLLKNATTKDSVGQTDSPCVASGSLAPLPTPESMMSHATTLAGPPGVLLFSDMFYGGAVLQRDEPVTVWGWSGGTNVTVTLGPGAEGAKGYSAGAAVNASRVWLLRLPAQPSGWNRTLSVQDGTGSITVNVSFGETVLCVGQSNMGMQVGPSYRGFDADNASAESAASVRYTGRIFLHSSLSRWKAAASRHGDRDSTVWYPVTPESIKNFSAVCWYTGRTLFDTLGGEVPVGLAMNAVGGHAVESWLGPRQLEACRISTPCTAQQPLSKIWNATIIPMQPYTFGSMVWDQAEQDLVCDRVAPYPCMQQQLAESYRAQFDSDMPFVAVQLPGYASGVFPMRLAQARGANQTNSAAVIATYDLSCAFDATHGCPYGNVHNPSKVPVGQRVASQLLKMKLVRHGVRATRGCSVSGCAPCTGLLPCSDWRAVENPCRFMRPISHGIVLLVAVALGTIPRRRGKIWSLRDQSCRRCGWKRLGPCPTVLPSSLQGALHRTFSEAHETAQPAARHQ